MLPLLDRSLGTEPPPSRYAEDQGGWPIIRLLPLDTPERIALVAEWLGTYDNYKWLDFGNAVQKVGPATLKIMAQRDLHVVRLFTADDADMPLGIVGLSNVDRNHKTASLWVCWAVSDTAGTSHQRHPAC